jgi:hypothetical protein
LTRHVFNHVDRAMATAYYHWIYLTVGRGVPETMIAHDPEFWLLLQAMIERVITAVRSGPDSSCSRTVLKEPVS